MKRPGSLNLSAVAVYCCQTDFMIGPTTFGSLIGAGSVLFACAEMSSRIVVAASCPPAFIAFPQRARVASDANAGLPS